MDIKKKGITKAMAILPVLEFPDARLKVVSKSIERVDEDIRKLMDDMFETMIAEDGCGLAAPQVGVHKRVVVIDFSYRDPEFKPMYLANPQILEESQEIYELNDGCLSVPEFHGYVGRAKKIKYRYLDRDNNPQEEEAEDLLAFCIQHEIDHLNGILFIDHLSALKRHLILGKLRKEKKNQGNL